MFLPFILLLERYSTFALFDDPRYLFSVKVIIISVINRDFLHLKVKTHVTWPPHNRAIFRNRNFERPNQIQINPQKSVLPEQTNFLCWFCIALPKWMRLKEGGGEWKEHNIFPIILNFREHFCRIKRDICASLTMQYFLKGELRNI